MRKQKLVKRNALTWGSNETLVTNALKIFGRPWASRRFEKTSIKLWRNHQVNNQSHSRELRQCQRHRWSSNDDERSNCRRIEASNVYKHITQWIRVRHRRQRFWGWLQRQVSRSSQDHDRVRKHLHKACALLRGRHQLNLRDRIED